MVKDHSEYIRKKVKRYSSVEFTKINLLSWLEKRNKCTLAEMKGEVLSAQKLVFTEKQKISFEGKKEERYKCYFVYSGSKGRCYILRFNKTLKIITVFPIGRITLRRYKKRFK